MIYRYDCNKFESLIYSLPESFVFFVDDSNPQNKILQKIIKRLSEEFHHVKCVQIDWKLFYEKFVDIYCDNSLTPLRIGFSCVEKIQNTSEKNLRKILSDIFEKQKKGRDNFVKFPEKKQNENKAIKRVSNTNIIKQNKITKREKKPGWVWVPIEENPELEKEKTMNNLYKYLNKRHENDSQENIQNDQFIRTRSKNLLLISSHSNIEGAKLRSGRTINKSDGEQKKSKLNNINKSETNLSKITIPESKYTLRSKRFFKSTPFIKASLTGKRSKAIANKKLNEKPDISVERYNLTRKLYLKQRSTTKRIVKPPNECFVLLKAINDSKNKSISVKPCETKYIKISENIDIPIALCETKTIDKQSYSYLIQPETVSMLIPEYIRLSIENQTQSSKYNSNKDYYRVCTNIEASNISSSTQKLSPKNSHESVSSSTNDFKNLDRKIIDLSNRFKETQVNKHKQTITYVNPLNSRKNNHNSEKIFNFPYQNQPIDLSSEYVIPTVSNETKTSNKLLYTYLCLPNPDCICEHPNTHASTSNLANSNYFKTNSDTYRVSSFIQPSKYSYSTKINLPGNEQEDNNFIIDLSLKNNKPNLSSQNISKCKEDHFVTENCLENIKPKKISIIPCDNQLVPASSTIDIPTALSESRTSNKLSYSILLSPEPLRQTNNNEVENLTTKSTRKNDLASEVQPVNLSMSVQTPTYTHSTIPKTKSIYTQASSSFILLSNSNNDSLKIVENDFDSTLNKSGRNIPQLLGMRNKI